MTTDTTSDIDPEIHYCPVCANKLTPDPNEQVSWPGFHYQCGCGWSGWVFPPAHSWGRLTAIHENKVREVV